MRGNVATVSKQVIDLIEPAIEEMGYDLVDVEYLSAHGRWVLRVYIDKSGGVDVEDCARVSRGIGDLIDVKDIIDHEYVLEVSSPGLNRPLKKERDFQWAIGKKVRVKTLAPIEGRRNYTGYLSKFQGGILTLSIEGGTVTLPWKEVAKANLVYEFK
ncbi:MAG: ribosome maturation factor RimP [Deltaproteobacteria bacterium]|nr:ribosome maturation factor RimP [Deltaproteobacteria bacterium]MBW2137102.1 ribosome maturation factor RimP [Deltaproteobacteria bacterium]